MAHNINIDYVDSFGNPLDKATLRAMKKFIIEIMPHIALEDWPKFDTTPKQYKEAQKRFYKHYGFGEYRDAPKLVAKKGGAAFEKCPVGTEIQTLIFSKDKFTEKKAKKWANNNDFKYGKVDEKEKTYRLRQDSPSDFNEGSFRTIELTDGVKAVIACPKESMDKGGMIQMHGKDLMGFEQFVKEVKEMRSPYVSEGDVMYKKAYDRHSGKSLFFRHGRRNLDSISEADAYAHYLYEKYGISFSRDLSIPEKKKLFGEKAKRYRFKRGGDISSQHTYRIKTATGIEERAKPLKDWEQKAFDVLTDNNLYIYPNVWDGTWQLRDRSREFPDDFVKVFKTRDDLLNHVLKKHGEVPVEMAAGGEVGGKFVITSENEPNELFIGNLRGGRRIGWVEKWKKPIVFASESEAEEFMKKADMGGKVVKYKKKKMAQGGEKAESGASVRYSSERKSPSDSATWYSEGTRMEGNDGNMWEIGIASNGVHRWVKVKEYKEGGEIDWSEQYEKYKEGRDDDEVLDFDVWKKATKDIEKLQAKHPHLAKGGEIDVNSINAGNMITDTAGETWEVLDADIKGAILQNTDDGEIIFLNWEQVEEYTAEVAAQGTLVDRGGFMANGGMVTTLKLQEVMKDGKYIHVDDLTKVLRRAPHWCKEKVGRLTFEKCLFKPYYELTSS